MNCVAGDLAVTVNAPQDSGLIVNVIRQEHLPEGRCIVSGPLWLVESIGSPFHITPYFLSQRAIWPDCMLRPIRDGEGEDQSLTWAPKHEPQPTKEPA